MTEIEIVPTKKPESRWIGVNPNINTNSEIYSKYIENPPPVLPVSDQNTPKTLAEKNKQKPNLDTIQSQSK
jgi:hypothetical protein